MRQKEIAGWLKGITMVLAVMGLVFFLVLLPVLAAQFRDELPEVSWLYWPGLLYGWGIGVVCFLILYQFWKVCVEIGRDNSFSMENAASFKHISRFALLLALIWFAGIAFLACSRMLWPGILIFLLVAVLLSAIVSILAAALSHLILKAYELKKENELTI